MAAGDRLAPRCRMGSGAGAGGESPRAGCEARGTQSLGVLSGGDDDGTFPRPPKGRGEGVRKAWWGRGARGRGMLEGSRWGAPLPGSPKCRDRGPAPQAGAAGGAWQSEGNTAPGGHSVCRGWFQPPLPSPRSASPPSATSSASPSVSHPLLLPPPPLSPASCPGPGCPQQWSPGLWCCAPELWP